MCGADRHKNRQSYIKKMVVAELKKEKEKEVFLSL
jgi:hypothetical protein